MSNPRLGCPSGGIQGFWGAFGRELGSPPTSDAEPIAFIVDDDVSVRKSPELLISWKRREP
jgi:hypothetical protein